MSSAPQSIWFTDSDPCTVVKKGSIVVMPGIWSYDKDNEQTPIKDIEVVIQEDTTLWRALFIVEQHAMDYLKDHGSDYLRDYRVEDIKINEDRFEFVLGT